MERHHEPDRQRQRREHGQRPDASAARARAPPTTARRSSSPTRSASTRRRLSASCSSAPSETIVRLTPSRSPLAMAREEPLEERRSRLERRLDRVELRRQLAARAPRVGSLPTAGQRLRQSPRASRRTSCAARPPSVSSSDARRAGLALVGDAVDQRGERRLRRAELRQAHRDRHVPAPELDAVVGRAPLRGDAPAERHREREHRDRERREHPPRDAGAADQRAEQRGQRIASGRPRRSSRRAARPAPGWRRGRAARVPAACGGRWGSRGSRWR